MSSSPSGKVKEAIVGEQFLAMASHPTKFTVTKLYTPKGPRFTFKNSPGGQAFKLEVEPELGFMNLRSQTFLDATSAQPVLHLQEVGLDERLWEAYRGKSTRESDKIFHAVNKSWCFPMGTKIEVFLRKSSDEPKPADDLVDGDSTSDEQKPADYVVDGNSSGKQTSDPDFVVQGNYYRGELTVSRGCHCACRFGHCCGGNDVAEIKRVSSLLKFSEHGGENTYDVRVNPGEDQAFVLALTVILDQMYYYDRDLRFSTQRR